MDITGGCMCGSVRYTIHAAPLAVRTCWCRTCQYIAAGNATVNAVFPKQAAAWTGELRVIDGVADSGNRMHRHFCPTCGTHVFSESDARPHAIVVRAGTLDNPELAKPASTIWVSSAPSWACIDDSIPKVEKQPPPVG